MGCEKKRTFKGDFKFFNLTGKMTLTLTGIGMAIDKVDLKGYENGHASFQNIYLISKMLSRQSEIHWTEIQGRGPVQRYIFGNH